jgi:hypothetical protein
MIDSVYIDVPDIIADLHKGPLLPPLKTPEIMAACLAFAAKATVKDGSLLTKNKIKALVPAYLPGKISDTWARWMTDHCSKYEVVPVFRPKAFAEQYAARGFLISASPSFVKEWRKAGGETLFFPTKNNDTPEGWAQEGAVPCLLI